MKGGHMTKAAVLITDRTGRDAGEALVADLAAQLPGTTPDALIVFATPRQDHGALLGVLAAAYPSAALVGCSSAGEFTGERSGEGMTSAMALSAPDMRFKAVLGRGLRADRAGAATAIAEGFDGLSEHGYRYRSALVLTDALAGFADDLVDQLTLRTGAMYRFFGGGAGDDARFGETHVFFGTQVVADAAVALEILSNKPIGIGVHHGWTPGGERLRVTAAAGMTLNSLNAVPAAEVFDAHAAATGQTFDHDSPVPFFLHNVLGVESTAGYRLRVPLAVHQDGSIACAADVPDGASSCIMSTTPESAANAAATAVRAAVDQLEGHQPAVALLFDCVATRLRLGPAFTTELQAVRTELGDVPFAGFNTYGQIAQAEGQFSGFHNCTAVVCVIPA